MKNMKDFKYEVPVFGTESARESYIGEEGSSNNWVEDSSKVALLIFLYFLLGWIVVISVLLLETPDVVVRLFTLSPADIK